ncbi:MAG: hypothetical protein ACO3FE_11275 [Planctomycetaceae bacterium]
MNQTKQTINSLWYFRIVIATASVVLVIGTSVLVREFILAWNS